MINKIKAIGEMLGDFSNTESYEAKKAFLTQLTMMPKLRDNTKNPSENRAIAIDFDLENKTFDIKLDKELIKENREYFFAFEAGKTFSSGGAKFALALNGLNYFTSMEKKSSSAFLSLREINDKYKDLKGFIKKIIDVFYVNKQLDLNKLLEDKKAKLEKEGDPYKNLFKNLFKFDAKFYPQIFLVKFKGKTIFEINEKITKDYLNLIYDKVFLRYFKGATKSTCHMCGTKTMVAKSTVPVWNFYGTTNELYFQQAYKKHSTLSFGVCPSCLQSVIMGQNFIKSSLSERLFYALDVYFIPHVNPATDDVSDLRVIVKTFKDLIESNHSYTQEIRVLKTALMKMNRKNLIFDFLFYTAPKGKNQFNINKLIGNVALNGILEIYKKFQEYSQEKYRLDLLNGNHQLNFAFLRYTLFYSEKSKAKCKPEHYKRELLEFLDSFIHQRKIDIKTMIHNFSEISFHRFHNHKDKQKEKFYDYKIYGEFDPLSPFKLMLVFQAFIDLNMLKYQKNPKEERKMLTKPPEKFEAFFENHPAIYQNAPDKQGLFLLGVMINRIVYAQQSKSSSFIKKVNFQGIQPRRIHNLVLQVKEFGEIYKIHEEGTIWGALTERLQNIEQSKLSPEEVVFYIFTGLSYAKYLGITFKQTHKGEENGD